MTDQEAFDTVLTTLRLQGIRSTYEGSCRYMQYNAETQGVLRCAAGHLMTDDSYHPNYEFRGIRTLLTRDLDYMLQRYDIPPKPLGSLRANLSGVSIELLVALQEVHDYAMPVTSHASIVPWEHKMSEVADTFKLTYTPPAV